MLITQCRLVLHDSLFYATREMGTLYETGRYLHNYALSYALFNDRLIRLPYFAQGYRPNYSVDMGKLVEYNTYVTPARPLQWDYLLVTWKMAQVTYYRKPERFGARGNFPENYGRAKELAPESTFEFAILSTERVRLPRWIRLGKWMSKAEVLVSHEEEITAMREGEFVSAFPLNPLDLPVGTRLLTYDLISMPPVSLLDHAHLTGPHYRLADGRCLPAGLAYGFGERGEGGIGH